MQAQTPEVSADKATTPGQQALQWTHAKPTVPGAYWVRGFRIGESDSRPALVEVAIDEAGTLLCNMNDSNTNDQTREWSWVEDLAERFEWCGPLQAKTEQSGRGVTDDAHPMQPIVFAPDGVIRFQENRIVAHLLDFATPLGCGMNQLAVLDYTDNERMQFAQLIGYSVSGYGDLGYASPESVQHADGIAAAMLAAQGGAA
ncbi:hypothetical protein [Pseudomonas sp.]|uniref:hypothetical protein n=1 Tax=Pseudomonas sp. TaxID=306 RepID=UPI0027362EB9|nr:hypothetical protein [Pseudomonas sp.]MDP2747981.1 hypothetical protein [Pseudomonas sp.]